MLGNMWFKKKKPINQIIAEVRLKVPSAFCVIIGYGPEVIIDSNSGFLSSYYRNPEKAWREAHKLVVACN